MKLLDLVYSKILITVNLKVKEFGNFPTSDDREKTELLGRILESIEIFIDSFELFPEIGDSFTVMIEDSNKIKSKIRGIVKEINYSTEDITFFIEFKYFDE